MVMELHYSGGYNDIVIHYDSYSACKFQLGGSNDRYDTIF